MPPHAFMTEACSAEELITRCGSELNGTDSLGMTPLLCAVQSRNPELVSTLLKLGAGVNQAYNLT